MNFCFKRFGRMLGAVSAVVSLGYSSIVFAAGAFPVVLVDKKTNKLHLGHYNGSGKIDIVKTLHTTLGKAVGDKIVTGDLKTPEGVYFILSKRTPPNLLKKFGVMAFPMDYPNPMDKREKKTGFGIMLHATDDPSRLTRNYDSDGCVVISNEELEDISREFQLGLTPVVVYDELKPDFLSEAARPELKEFFNSWVKAWSTKDIDNYIAAYSDDFRYNGMNRDAYRSFKNSLNKKYHRIDLQISRPRFYMHPKYDVIVFGQDYHSFDKNGRAMFHSVGTKFLYVKKDSKGRYQIVHEDFSHVNERPFSEVHSAAR